MCIFAYWITIRWTVIILFLLPPEPNRARGSTGRQRCVAVARLRSNNAGVHNTHIKHVRVLEVLDDPLFWQLFRTAFSMLIANGRISTYMTVIISGVGYSPLNSFLLSVSAGIITGCSSLLADHLTSKY
ncbi:uncharacterized protein A1O9_01904, partial [Exophiala aquamarina CBS 119918]